MTTIFLLQVLCVLICVAGLRMGKAVINSFTAAKVLICTSFFLLYLVVLDRVDLD